MLPRSKRVVLESSEVEEYKNNSLFGHWILVKKSSEDLQRNTNIFSKEDYYYNGDDNFTPPSVSKFTTRDVVVRPGSAERYLNVLGRGYLHVDGECFAGDPFDRVNTVNADDNRLRLVTFRTFKSVRRLSLRRNHLEFVEPIDGDLAETLIYLDVSENRLKPDDIYRLSMSKLEQLYVSANKLTAIPASITDYHCFLSLELLDLSDNCFSCPKTFYILSTLHNLKILDMHDNQISFIPYLVTKQKFDTKGIDAGKKTTDYQGKMQDLLYDNKDDTNELVYHVQHIPFVSLNMINLSNNRIAQSSSVLSLICWPSLTNIILTANTISLKKNLATFKDLKSTFNMYNIKITR